MSETSIGYCDPGEGGSGTSWGIECGQRANSPSLVSVSMLGVEQIVRGDTVLEEDAITYVKLPSEKRSGGPSDDSCASDASFITVGRRPKRLRVTPVTTLQSRAELLPDSTFEVCVVSKTDLPKQFGLAKMLQINGVTGVMKIKFFGPCKVRVQFTSKEEAEKLLSAGDFNNDDRRSYWSNQLNCIYGIVKGVELEVDEEEFLKNIDGLDEILGVKRLNRLDDSGRWVKSEVIRICFKGVCLPAHIYVYGCRLKVAPYNSPVTQCSKCWKFGHLFRFCPSNRYICPKCGGAHANCENTVFKCLNCKGPHMALNKSCPVFLREKKIRGIMATEGCVYKKALWICLQENKKQPAAQSLWSPPPQDESSAVLGANKSYRDALITNRVIAGETGSITGQDMAQKPKSRNRVEVESQQEARRRKKPKTRVPTEEKFEDPIPEQLAHRLHEERRQREEEKEREGQKRKTRVGGFQKFIERMKDILLSNETWQLKLKCLCKFIVEEFWEMCKGFFKEFEIFKFFFTNLNG